MATGAAFADAAAEWLRYVEHDRKRRASTIEDYRNVVRHNLLPEFGETPLEQITTDWIDAYRAGLVAEGRLSDRTINKLLVLLHGIFRRAQRVYGLPGNPVAAVERQPVQRSGEFEVLSPGEVTLFYWRFEDWTIIQALYFSVVTLTTVGYGDLTPTSDGTQIFTIIYILTGLGVLVAFLASVAENYIEQKAEGGGERERLRVRRQRRQAD